MKDMENDFLGKLEKKIREIRERIRLSSATCPHDKIGEARRHLNQVLQAGRKYNLGNRIAILLGALRRAAGELDKSRRDFHSKEIKSIREDIDEILKEYN